MIAPVIPDARSAIGDPGATRSTSAGAALDPRLRGDDIEAYLQFCAADVNAMQAYTNHAGKHEMLVGNRVDRDAFDD